MIPASGALAQSACQEPAVPPPLDGATATADQLRATMAAARDFVAQSNVYQDCVKQEADAARQAGGAPDDTVAARIAANQVLKQKVSDAAAGALDAYKQAHAN